MGNHGQVRRKQWITERELPRLRGLLGELRAATEQSSDRSQISLSIDRSDARLLEAAISDAIAAPGMRKQIDQLVESDFRAAWILHDAASEKDQRKRLRKAIQSKGWLPKDGKLRHKFPGTVLEDGYIALTTAAGAATLGGIMEHFVSDTEDHWVVGECPLRPDEAIMILAKRFNSSPQSFLRELSRRAKASSELRKRLGSLPQFNRGVETAEEEIAEDLGD